MSTNQERRAEARQRLREQMEAQARREKQLKIASAAVVVIVLLGLVGLVVWNKQREAKAEEYAANWLTCEYPESTEQPEKIDLEEVEEQGEEAVEMAEDLNEKIDIAAEKKRDGEAPTGDQPRRGTADVTLALDRGEVPIVLDRSKAPCNTASFVGLVEQKFYDDAPCHRLTVAREEDGPGLSVLQCGDPTGTGLSGPGYTVVDEPPTDLAVSEDGSGLSMYPRGTVAMAKSQNPNSAGSQFFLVYEDTALPPEYSVIGTIGEPGLEVLDEIAKDGTKSRDPQNPDSEVPKKPVLIESAQVTAQEGLPEA